jgi:glycosyltransferase involved in cell wall biosynthesis
VPAVATVHDLSVFDVPWAFARRRAIAERAIVSSSINRADAVIAVSAFTAERVMALLGRQAVVIHEAPSPSFGPPASGEVEDVVARYGLPPQFVLHVGTVEPRKDIETVAAAARIAGVPLVLAGAIPDTRRVPAGVRTLGYVPSVDLGPLYGAATIVAYPSRYEGFGLPPLEAMACGAPVVASATSSLPEVLGDGAVLVPPGDAAALAAALTRIANDADERAELVTRGQRRAASFSWDTAAKATLDLYAKLGVT